MNILLISTSALPVPPVGCGGMEQVVYDLAIELAKSHKVTVACPANSKLPVGVGHLVTNDLQEHKDERLSMLQYGKFLDKFDIVHDNSHFKFYYYPIKENPNIKYCSTLHNPELIIEPVMDLNLISPTQSNSDYFFNKYGYRSKVVYHGVEVSKYKYNKDKGDYFLVIGRPQPIKGSLEAVQFCRELDVPCKVIAGALEDNPDEYWIKIAQLCKYKSKWQYLGGVSHEAKIDLLSKAKGYIFPLNWNIEPFGLVVIEALASGTPVIAYDKGPMKELIQDGVTGFLPKTPEEFKEAMRKIDTIQPKNCYKDALRRWDRSRMSSDYEDLYQQIIDGLLW